MPVYLDDNVKSILKVATTYYMQLIKYYSEALKNNSMTLNDITAYTIISQMYNKSDQLENAFKVFNIKTNEPILKDLEVPLTKDEKFAHYNKIRKYIETMQHRYKNEKMQKEDNLIYPGVTELVYLSMYYHPSIAKQFFQLDDVRYSDLMDLIELKVVSAEARRKTNPTPTEHKNKKNSQFPLSKYGAENLIEANYSHNPLVGNEQALRKAIKKLLSGNSLIILGEAGVGKTTLVKGIAYNIKMKSVPHILQEKQIISLPISGIVANTQYVGTLESHVNEIIKYAKANKNSIFYIDEIHTIMGAGQSRDNNIDVSNLLKPHISDGTMQIIGATTTEEFDKTIAKNPAFRRRFRTMTLPEPTEEEVLKIAKRYIEIKQAETNINWDVNNVLLERLIELTCSKNRSFFETVNNPNITLCIIDDIFASALYYEKTNVDKQDIIESIEDNEILASTKKTKLIEELSLDEYYTPKPQKTKAKILTLYPPKKEN